MRILFRVDGNRAMGLGHVMRCRALAEALIALGHGCDFVLGDAAPELSSMLRASGLGVHMIDPARDIDSVQTAMLAKALHADGIVVDGYHLEDAWRAGLRGAGLPILAFADGPLRPRHADMLLDAASPNSTNPQELFGPAYVLLRRELVEAATLAPLPMAERKSILVTFGGSDPAGLTLPTVAALAAVLPETPLSGVVGSAAADRDRLAAAVAEAGERIEVHVAPARMGNLMRRAGLAVSAAGGTVGELAALGVPLVLAIVADNQVTGAEACAEAGWCTPIDARHDPHAAATLAAAAAALWLDPAERARRAALARTTVDPHGAERAAAAFVDFIANASRRQKLTE
jgi:UDP-2,4-diacetamido-2,4,6-trideoxy-beta-L-altropyranose hydrolase